jgi:hypothetical protein
MTDTLARQRQIVGTTSDWSLHDLTLGAGELALERRTDGSVRAKVGNGALAFSAAPYLTIASAALTYRGSVNPTLTPPVGTVPGDLFSANPGGVVNAAWGAPAAGATMVAGDFLAKSDVGAWNIIPGTTDLSAFVTRGELGAATGGALVGLTGRTVKDATTKSRTAPHANFAWVTAIFPTITSDAPGRVMAGTNIRTSWETTYPPASFSGGSTTLHVAYNGADGGSGSNLANAFKSLGRTRTAAGGTVLLYPDGPIAPGDVRFADTNPSGGAGGQPRRFLASAGRAVVGFEGDSLTALTWTAIAAGWTTTVVSANAITRLLRSDVIDKMGFPQPLPRYPTEAALQAATYGWFFDPPTKKLTVRVGNINVETSFKAKLVPIWTGPDGGTANRIYVESARAIFENIDFVGTYVHVLSVAGQPQAKAWFRNCRFLYSPTHAIVTNGGEVVTQDCYVHRSLGDGVNYNDDVVGFTCRGIEANLRTFQTGDDDTYPAQVNTPNAPGSFNKQGSSVHSGNVATFGGYFDQAAGPLIQDTGGMRWAEGPEFGWSTESSGTLRLSILMQANQSWLSRINAPSGGGGAIFATDAAVVRTFEVAGLMTANSGATFVPYIPPT